MRQSSKILVVSSLTGVATANYLVRALRDRGHALLVCSDVRSGLADVVCSGIIDVARLIETRGFDPDLVLFIEGGTMQLFPVGLERLRCRTAWYGIDTHMDYAKHLHISRLFDVTFVAQKQYVERLQKDGIRQVFWLPLAFAPELHPALEMDRKYAVAYVGSVDPSVNPERHRLLAAIRGTVSPVFIGAAPPEEMGRIYAQAKLVFNRSVGNDVNMRFFEAMGAGAALVTNAIHNNGITDLFEPGTDFVEYTDDDSLLSQIQALLHDDPRREAIAASARKKVRALHSYGNRADALLQASGNCAKVAKPVADNYFPVFTSSRLPSGVLWACNTALRSMQASRQARVYLQPVRFAVSLLEILLRGVYRVRRWLVGA